MQRCLRIENANIILMWQLGNSSMEYNPLYDVDKGFKVMPSSFHEISDIEFQDNWGSVWYAAQNLSEYLV